MAKGNQYKKWTKEEIIKAIQDFYIENQRTLKHVENTYNINYRECFSMTDEELLNVIMEYSDNQDILPSTGIISKKESGIYHEIIKRYEKYSNFAKKYG
jgi:hypothetical protein